MKKLLIIFIVLIIILAGCAKENEKPSITSVKPYEEGKYYELYDITKYSYPQIQYFIFDEDHDILDYGVLNRDPRVILTNGLIKFRIGCGTACFKSKYFDPENKLVSEWFFKPIAESNTM